MLGFHRRTKVEEDWRCESEFRHLQWYERTSVSLYIRPILIDSNIDFGEKYSSTACLIRPSNTSILDFSLAKNREQG